MDAIEDIRNFPFPALSFSPDFVSFKRGESKHFADIPVLNDINLEGVTYKRHGKTVLHDVSLRKLACSKVITIMGPPHSGKTKLLNILAGYVIVPSKDQELVGTFTANGKDYFEQLRAGFVLRKEALYPTSTVIEAVQFSAALRMPMSVSLPDREALIQDVVQSCGLGALAHRQIKTLTPGQRKMVAIAVELASLPNVLLLDEPTSGIEPVDAWTMMQVLIGLAKRKACAVICSLADPTSEVFTQLDYIVLMGHGRVLFKGHYSKLDAAFAAKSLLVPSRTSPSDYALLCARYLPIEQLPVVVLGSEADVEAAEPLKLMLASSSSVTIRTAHARGALVHRNPWVPFKELFIREVLNLKRDPRVLIARVISTAIVMGVSANVFIYVGNQLSSSYVVGSHFGSAVFTMFTASFAACLTGVLTLSEERPVFVRERAADAYRTGHYVLAKALPEFLANFIISVVTVLIMYWAAKWNGSFIWFVMCYFLLLESITSWAYVLAFSVTRLPVAVALVALVMVPQLLFMGTFVKTSALPPWLEWCTYLSVVKYAENLWVIEEFKQANCIQNNPYQKPPNAICYQWLVFGQQEDVDFDSAWAYCLILVLFAVALRFIAFVAVYFKIRHAKRYGESV